MTAWNLTGSITRCKNLHIIEHLDKLSAILQLIFFLLKLSLAAPKIATWRIIFRSHNLSKSPPSLHIPKLLPSLLDLAPVNYILAWILKTAIYNSYSNSQGLDMRLLNEVVGTQHLKPPCNIFDILAINWSDSKPVIPHLRNPFGWHKRCGLHMAQPCCCQSAEITTTFSDFRNNPLYLINSTLTSVGTSVFSFWSPSLGPTWTWSLPFMIPMTYRFEHKFSLITIIRHITSSLTIPTSTILTDEGRVLMWPEEDNRRLKEQWSCY